MKSPPQPIVVARAGIRNRRHIILKTADEKSTIGSQTVLTQIQQVASERGGYLAHRGLERLEPRVD